MRRAIPLLLLLTLALLASGRLALAKITPDRHRPTPRPVYTPLPMRQNGKLTRAALEDARSAVRSFQPWDDAYKSVTQKIGKPPRVEKEVCYWYAKDGNSCVELMMENLSGSLGVVNIGEYGRADSKKYSLCDKY